MIHAPINGKRRDPWGKTGERPGEFHHLAHHCADVAACFEAITALPTIRARLEAAAGAPLSPSSLARLTAIVFLHDAGKLHPGFQAKGWLPDERPALLRGHLAEGLALLLRASSQGIGDASRVWRQLGLSELGWWDDLHPFILASLSHHGRPLDVSAMAAGWEAVMPSGTTYDPADGARLMGGAMRAWFPDAFAGSPSADNQGADGYEDGPPLAPRLQHLFAGLVALSDWLGSDRRFFPFESEFRDDYIRTARAQAARAVAAIRLDVEAARRPAAFAAGAGTGFTALTGFAAPAPHQQATADVPADRRLVILEAETGAGKTEAAVWRFARLFAAGAVDGLYFALPTRSAAVQIHGRVNRLLERLTGPDGLKAVLAVPGYLKVGDAVGEALPHWRVRWDDEGERAEDELAARWAAESARRFLAAPVAVGTVDQAMLAALQVKHAHLRGACLSRCLLVVDEVHASDRYMGEILARLLDIHLGAGGHALLMSATLGSWARTRWLGGTRAPDFAAAVAAPYPEVWSARGTSKGTASSAIPAASGEDPRARRKTVAMTPAAGWSAEEAADRALAAARSGAKVLVIRNTVTAAVATWEAVQAAGGDDLLLQLSGGPALHHGRFAAEDREALDRAVEAALAPRSGPGPGRPGGGLIVIGTQTLEQSLDIDADHLVTDLCPIDVLLQRLGRLHRHSGVARAPGFTAPSCVVLAPRDGLEPLLAPRFDNGLGAFAADRSLSGVYMDLSVLELTRRLVADRPEWTIPDHNRLLVESALHEDKIEELHAELGGGWSAYRDRLLGKTDAEAQAARGVVLPVRTPFGEERFPGDEAAIRTRLGAEGARLVFPEPVAGPFGHAVSALTLPAHWSRGLDPTAPVTVERDGDTLRVAVDGRRFRYDRRGVAKET